LESGLQSEDFRLGTVALAAGEVEKSGDCCLVQCCTTRLNDKTDCFTIIDTTNGDLIPGITEDDCCLYQEEREERRKKEKKEGTGTLSHLLSRSKDIRSWLSAVYRGQTRF
jgi:hypothetical protein